MNARIGVFSFKGMCPKMKLGLLIEASVRYVVGAECHTTSHVIDIQNVRVIQTI